MVSILFNFSIWREIWQRKVISTPSRASCNCCFLWEIRDFKLPILTLVLSLLRRGVGDVRITLCVLMMFIIHIFLHLYFHFWEEGWVMLESRYVYSWCLSFKIIYILVWFFLFKTALQSLAGVFSQPQDEERAFANLCAIIIWLKVIINRNFTFISLSDLIQRCWMHIVNLLTVIKRL